MQDIRLFINNKEVEFSADPKILFNYKGTELSNPTIVKNSFTKTITIEGTPQNNDIFGNIFDLQRTQDSSLYNPTQKVPFKLFINSELIERGYAKLDSIKQANHNISYQVTLYGGLGDFFYNLSYSPDSNDKKSLADLRFITDELSEPNLDFTINKETVYEAWRHILRWENVDDKWNVINFAPCYNGIPSDFGADKALFNNNDYNNNIFENNYYDGTKTYQPIYHGAQNLSGYSLAQFSEPMTCDETFDLRSYLQRPVVSVERTLKAIFQPENNGGYEVSLDPHFFDWDNPYWRDGWVTLPMLRTITEGGVAEVSETISGATLENLNDRLWEVDFDSQSLSKLSNTRMKVNISWTPSSTMSQSKVYDNRILNVSTGAHLFHGNTYVKKLFNSNGVIMQLWALDLNGNIVAQSDAYLLGSNQYQADSSIPLWEGFCGARETPDIQPLKYKWIKGQWTKNGNSYDFCDSNGNVIGLSFSLNTSVEYTNLVMKIKLPTSDYVKFAYRGETPHYEDNIYGQTAGPYENKFPLFSQPNNTANGDYTYVQAMDIDRVWGTLSYDIVEFETTAQDYEAFFSDTTITKEKLLSTSYTPADFLISYCKTFGLYFYRDPSEEALDPVAAPNGVIHIMDRDTFFTDEYEDIEPLIDRSKDMTITPAMASTKWYEFQQEQIDSQAEKDYKDTYGRSYGSQTINTNYDFDSNTTQLYDGNVFKSGIMVREKDKYFTIPFGGVRNSIWNGCSYSLFSPTAEGYDGYSFDLPIHKPSEYALNPFGLPYYDLMPKLQCHGKDNDPVDGDGVLLFYIGEVPVYGEGPDSAHYYTYAYWITDDVPDMLQMNGGEPCWIMGNSEYAGGPDGDRIAIRMESLPFFSRDKVAYGQQEGNVTHSWNFGRPRVTFVPNVFNTEGDSIYEKCWKDYIHDLYSDDGKKLTCFVRFDQRPHPSYFRKWYWFDNAIWRLNDIKDWNVSDWSSVQCEFIKVQDTNNYKLAEINQGGTAAITVEPETIGGSGGVVTYTVRPQDCGPWYIRGEAIRGEDEEQNRYFIWPSTTAGTGCLTTFNVTVPPTSAGTPITWTARFLNSYDEVLGEPSFTQLVGDAPDSVHFYFIDSAATISSAADVYVFGFVCEGVDPATIDVETSEDWIVVTDIDPTSGAVTVSIPENPDNIERMGTITLTGIDIFARNRRTEMTLVQEASSVQKLIFIPPEIIFSNTSTYNESKLLTVSSTTNWTASKTHGDTDAFIFSPSSGAAGATDITIRYRQAYSLSSSYYTSIDFVSEDASGSVPVRKLSTMSPSDYLTFFMEGNGFIKWGEERQVYSGGSATRLIPIYYSKNGGQWTRTQNGSSSYAAIQVRSGDVIRFYGETAQYGYDNFLFDRKCVKFLTDVPCRIGGNIMSMVSSAFTGLDTTSYFAFSLMFGGCTGLYDISNLYLPATNLGNACYGGLFAGCTGLINGSLELPATTLTEDDCYNSMFYNCSSLVDAPTLPATAVSWGAYASMFEGCSSLVTAPALPATVLGGHCYDSMFAGCTSLRDMPNLPATTLADFCYVHMFDGCGSLTGVPATLPAMILNRGAYLNMFAGCTSLTDTPSLPATGFTFGEYGTDDCTAYRGMFSGCTHLTGTPTTLPAINLSGVSYAYMFAGCTRLTAAPSLPATRIGWDSYEGMFMNSGLLNAPNLPATDIEGHCYRSMFQGCRSLTGVSSTMLPATSLKTQCYASMFKGCTQLATAPDLPAITLSYGCYAEMFSGCTNLNYVKCLAVSHSDSDTNKWLAGVSMDGTFVKNASATWSRGESGVPQWWTLTDA